jgi:hypothetical protein
MQSTSSAVRPWQRRIACRGTVCWSAPSLCSSCVSAGRPTAVREAAHVPPDGMPQREALISAAVSSRLPRQYLATESHMNRHRSRPPSSSHHCLVRETPLLVQSHCLCMQKRTCIPSCSRACASAKAVFVDKLKRYPDYERIGRTNGGSGGERWWVRREIHLWLIWAQEAAPVTAVFWRHFPQQALHWTRFWTICRCSPL